MNIAGFTSSAPDILVSVIVPVRDDVSGVEQLIDDLRMQTLDHERFEMIIADDGSREALPRLAPPGQSIRITRERAQNAYAARNRAARLARGRVLAFTDADCRPRADWLVHGIEALRLADLVGGHIELELPDELTAWAIIDGAAFDQERYVAMGKAAAANMFLRRALFERYGGFDATLPSGGDWDFAERCVKGGARLVYSPLAVVDHPVRSSARAFLLRRWRIEHAMAMRMARQNRPVNRSREAVIPRRFGFAVGYDPDRVRRLGAPPGWRTRLRTVPARYLISPPVEALAQAIGWLRARRPRVEAPPLEHFGESGNEIQRW
jgi:glycosyltransferase involved in cell wall biosynthesis